MTLLAYGAKEVRALEAALGGKPPKKAADQALSELKLQMRERYERRNAQIAKMRPLMEKSRAPLLELIKKDKAAVAALEKRRTLTLARSKEKLRMKHEHLKIDPRMVSGSGFAQASSLRCALQRREWRRLGLFQHQQRHIQPVHDRQRQQRLSIGGRGGLVLGNRGRSVAANRRGV